MDPNELVKLIRLTYTGFSEGALLALIALGLVLIYKSTDVINFAHGYIMMLGAYVGFQVMMWFALLTSEGWTIGGLELGPTALSEPVIALIGLASMITVMMVVGILIERFILRPLIGEPVISVIMVTIGLGNIIQAVVGAIWGKLPQRLPVELLPDPGRITLDIEGARRPLLLDSTNLVAIGAVLMLVFTLIIFFRFSKQGIAMRATADDQQAAMSMGISIKTIFAITWSLAAITAGLAGLLIADLTSGVSGDIPGVGLRAFPVIILGGLDSIAGAIIGGFAIGLIETFASGYIDPSLKSVIPYIVLLIVLMIRPYGLFGQRIIERV